MTLAERPILPVIAFDAQQAARHLDLTAWRAIAAAEAEIGTLACARLTQRLPTTSVPCETFVGLALRAIEGALRFGRPSFGARDAAWAIAVRDHAGDVGEAFTPPVDLVYDVVLDVIQQVAPSAEPAARSAVRSILDTAATIAARPGGRVQAAVAPPTPLSPLVFRGLADLPHVAYVVDRSLRYAYVNGAWAAFAQENEGGACLAPSIVGQSWIEAISGPDRGYWLAVAEQILAGAIPSHREEIACHSPTACRFIVVTASPLRLSEDDLDVAGLVFVTYDLTELRRAEADRLWLDQEGRRVRDVFFGTIAHDLRNPLTTIKGRAQLLKLRLERSETPFPAGFADSLGSIMTTADQMVSQIEELLGVAQVEAGQPAPLRPRPTDLVALIQSVLTAHEDGLVGHRCRLDAPGQPIVGTWDDIRIRRVVENLVSNAIKYTPDDGEIIVRVWSERADGRAWALFSVRDHGIGIPAADLPSIFTSFFRGSNVDAGTGGFGLGLAGAHQLVSQHGGRIDVSSEIGVGTTFTVRLPLDELEAGQQVSSA